MSLGLLLATTLAVSPIAGHADHASSQIVETTLVCDVDALPGLFAQLRRVARETGLDPLAGHVEPVSPAYAGRIADFWQIAFAVLGVREHEHDDPNHRSVSDRVGRSSLDRVPCDAAVRARDRMAWSMGLVGYSAREIADVLTGHLTRADLDEALSRTMAGESKANVAAFLDSRWREPEPLVAEQPSAMKPAGASSFVEALDDEIVALAREHRVEPALVRAVIAAESGGNASAVSSAGAIGLMQLMPRTAAALGVNPWQPLENLRGGIAYLGGLLRAYGEDVRLALIAYNAGPSHADLVRSGRAVAYRETRKYVEAILARYP
jgi:soluble lytic murein transglycosylase-like protein